MTTSFEEILAAAKPREAAVGILLDQGLLDRHADLEAEQADAVAAGDAERAVELARQVKALEDERAAAEIEFRFVGVGYRRWMDLLRDHPPVKGQTGVDHNPDTFPLAAIAASCVEPEMSADQVGELATKLNLAQWEALWATCLLVNKGGDQAPKSVVADGLIRRLSGASEKRATTTESRGQRSSAA